MIQRDAKGRFMKGNKEGNRFKTNGEQREIARAGGIASGESKRTTKGFIHALDLYMSKQVTNKNGEKATVEEVSAFKFGEQLMSGNLKALKLYFQLKGMLMNKTEITGKDGKDLIPDNREDLIKELERLQEATQNK